MSLNSLSIEQYKCDNARVCNSLNIAITTINSLITTSNTKIEYINEALQNITNIVPSLATDEDLAKVANSVTQCKNLATQLLATHTATRDNQITEKDFSGVALENLYVNTHILADQIANTPTKNDLNVIYDLANDCATTTLQLGAVVNLTDPNSLYSQYVVIDHNNPQNLTKMTGLLNITDDFALITKSAFPHSKSASDSWDAK